MKVYIIKIISTVILLLCFYEITVLAAENKDSATRDDVSMVLVPGGKYSMGTEDGDPDETPIHEVYVDSFILICRK